MAEESQMCPNCGTRARPGEILCGHCGTNLETGETWQARVKRAKQKKTHEENFARGIMLLPTIAFALLVFAGFMYQRGAQDGVAQNKDEVATYVQQLERADRLVAFGQTEQARSIYSSVAEELESKASEINPGDAYSPGDEKEESEREQEAARKTILVNLQMKAQHKLDNLK